MLKDLQVVVDNAFILKFNIRTLLQTPSFFGFFCTCSFFSFSNYQLSTINE